MISKELYEAVIELDYRYITREEYDEINIHELAHKCKEWAYNKGFMLLSGLYIRGKIWCEIYKPLDLNNTITQFGEDTEPEAIFKACEWILKQKENNEK